MNERSDFLPEEVRLVGDELRCLRKSVDWAPQFREGFILSLSHELACAVERELPKLGRVARGASALRGRVGALMGDAPWQHMTDFVTNVVAYMVIDSVELDAALAKVAERHFGGKDERWMAVFADDGVRQLFVAAAAS